MAEFIAGFLDSRRLLLDLQRASEIVQCFSGCLDPEAIAQSVTDGLVNRFNCVFARIWLVEPGHTALRLVASSGLYTRIDGFFARVTMGAYKVGKIAQNRVSFLSNNLAEESWVKDREWAIANQIRGFAGFPLLVSDSPDEPQSERVIGVLAVFSHDPLTPEFLEVLQVFCTTVAVALETALHYQSEKSEQFQASPYLAFRQLALSDQIAAILGSVRLTLIGTEHALNLSNTYLFLQVAEVLSQLNCRHCRLLYQADAVVLEALAIASDASPETEHNLRSHFGSLIFMASCLGGNLQSEMIANQKVFQVSLKLPYPHSRLGSRLQIRCRQPVLQLAFTHLAYAAGLQVYENHEKSVPLLLTDDLAQLYTVERILWVLQGTETIPPGVSGSIDLSISPGQLREAVEALERGETWGIDTMVDKSPLLSERERQILGLLAEGLRDRDIANQLFISDSTVKFHINNVLRKLKARTRFQALHQAIKRGWI